MRRRRDSSGTMGQRPSADCQRRPEAGRAARRAPREAGQVTLEYVLLLAAVVLPLVGVIYLLWEILMYFYWNTALVVSIPYL